MHPYEERPSQEYWEAEAPPDPTVARNGDEFLAELEALAQWSGVTPDQIEHRMRANGDYVAEGIVADTLRGSTLPSEELLVPMLWALGCDDETVELWVWVRGNIVAEAYRAPEESKKFSDGTLANAVKQRRDQSGWRGLHRRAFPDADENSGKYVPKRSRSTGSRLAILTGGGWSSRLMIGLVVAGAVTLVAGVAVALSGGGDDGTVPAAGDIDRKTCCAPSGTPASQTPASAGVTDPPALSPTPRVSSTRPTNSPTPRPTTPSPTPSPAQAPQLNGNGSATCASQDSMWVVNVSVSATLTGGSGADPQGQASHGGTSRSLNLTGSGTSFSGQANFTIGPDTEAAQGSIQWSITVSVAGASPAQDSGAASFNCPS